MTPGDIIKTPTGRFARYEGGGQYGAEFVYLDAAGQPIWRAGEKTYDTFCTKDIRLLMQIQPEYSRV